LAALLLSLPLSAQNSAGWTVKPEWVQAHEEFLSSDVLAGRGSATRDEHLAASYVASEFLGYGLKMAPGMSSYIQTAELTAPQLDGHATLTAGSVALTEGRDFQLLDSPGDSVSGPMIHVTAADLNPAAPASPTFRGAVLLLPAGLSPVQQSIAFRRSGAAAVILPEDENTRRIASRYLGKTRIPITLKDTPRLSTATILTVPAAIAAQLSAVSGVASIAVHVLAETAPRETFNAIGYLPGTDPAAGTILLTAHLDHLGTGRPVNGDTVYNGANDDASGTTAVLELAHALGSGPRLKRSVLFVCYGSEEAGELGSTYFGEHPPVPLTDLVANLEFEMIGAQDPKMPRGVLLLTGWERSNLGPTLKQHGALLGPDPYPEQHFFERSDNYALALKGVVAHTAAGWGTVPTYHQPSDDLAHLDIPFMTAAIQSLVEPVRWLASSNFKPRWNPDGQPKR
jgi:hypothetical protein